MANKKNFQVPKIISLDTEILSYYNSFNNLKNHILNLDRQVFCTDLLKLFYTYNLSDISFLAKKIVYTEDSSIPSSYLFSLEDSYQEKLKKTFSTLDDSDIDNFFASSNNYISSSSQNLIIDWIIKSATINNIKFFHKKEDLIISINKNFLEILSHSAYGDDYPIIKHQILDTYLNSKDTSSHKKVKI